MAKQPKLLPRTMDDISKNKTRNTKPKHNWRDDKHPYYRMMEERGISVTRMYRQYQISQPSLNNIVNYRDSYLKSLIELKLIIPEFDLIDYIVNYIEHNQENFKNKDESELDLSRDILNYCKKYNLDIEIPKKNELLDLQRANKSLREKQDLFDIKNEQLTTSLVEVTKERDELAKENERLRYELERLKNNQLQTDESTQKNDSVDDEQVNTFFKNLEKIFKSSGLSQKAFTSQYGLPRTTVRRYLSRDAKPSRKNIETFSEKLGVDLLVEQGDK